MGNRLYGGLRQTRLPSFHVHLQKKKKSVPLSQLSQPQFFLVFECPPLKQPQGLGAAVGWARPSCPPSRQDKDFSQTLWNHVGNSTREIRMLLPKEGEEIQSRHARLTLCPAPLSTEEELGIGKKWFGMLHSRAETRSPDFSLLLSFLSFCFLVSSFFFLSVRLIVYYPCGNIYVHRADGFKSWF